MAEYTPEERQLIDITEKFLNKEFSEEDTLTVRERMNDTKDLKLDVSPWNYIHFLNALRDYMNDVDGAQPKCFLLSGVRGLDDDPSEEIDLFQDEVFSLVRSLQNLTNITINLPSPKDDIHETDTDYTLYPEGGAKIVPKYSKFLDGVIEILERDYKTNHTSAGRLGHGSTIVRVAESPLLQKLYEEVKKRGKDALEDFQTTLKMIRDGHPDVADIPITTLSDEELIEASATDKYKALSLSASFPDHEAFLTMMGELKKLERDSEKIDSTIIKMAKQFRADFLEYCTDLAAIMRPGPSVEDGSEKKGKGGKSGPPPPTSSS